MPILTFFSNKGGVGQTSLVYHLAWMYAALQKRIVVVDADPQANLSAALLSEERLETLCANPGATVYHCLQALASGSEIVEPELQHLSANLYLIPGAVELSSLEGTFAAAWSRMENMQRLYQAMRLLCCFWWLGQLAAKKVEADLILVDAGSNLGAINRAVLAATDFVIIPLGTDIFSFRGLQNLGPTLQSWRGLWQKQLDNWHNNAAKELFPDLGLPTAGMGEMKPIGYTCRQPEIHLSRPIRVYDKWLRKIPQVYRQSILGAGPTDSALQDDPYCLATIRHYRSLVPMALEHRKPIFALTPADGAVGSHATAVLDARRDFQNLAKSIADKVNVGL